MEMRKKGNKEEINKSEKVGETLFRKKVRVGILPPLKQTMFPQVIKVKYLYLQSTELLKKAFT